MTNGVPTELAKAFSADGFISSISLIVWVALGVVLAGIYFYFSLRRLRLRYKELSDQANKRIEIQTLGGSYTQESAKLPPRGIVPKVPEGLTSACADGECVLYAGSGLSAQSGLPVWGDLMRDMIYWALQQDIIDQNYARSLIIASDQGEVRSASEGLLEGLGDRQVELYEFMRNRLLAGKRLSSTHEALSDIPFSAALTTNLDALLETSFLDRNFDIYTPRDSERLLQALSSRAFFVLKLYGDLMRSETVILSSEQYQDEIALNRFFSTFMEALFFSRTIFFLGAQLDGIEDYLLGIRFSETRPRQHYALVDVVSAGPSWELKANTLQRKYGIEVIPYSPTEGHPEVRKFVARLVEDVKERLSRKSQAASRIGEIRTTPKGALKRLRLDNIGPFGHLELDLNPGWTTLLGDNGVGKSNILRAIALAICGVDAQGFAHQLIKNDKLGGSILLETDRDTIYKTELTRSSLGAEINSIPMRPLEAEGWLALGFPPSRLLTPDRPSSPEARVERRPSGEDLLPLLKGGLDPRINKLKQWLVNLEYWIKDAKEKKQDFRQYESLRAEFFNVIAKLAIGVKLKYEDIKPETYEIIVNTYDGAVPLEAISQGTASLIGWVGILIQRLYETAPANVPPLERYALVLIDEIDAHMHPSWQRSLVDTLKNLFPNIQFIATTHSPLIVNGLDKSEIYTISRKSEEGRSTIIAERPESAPQGWYSDMVLTSDLFKLETTLPPKVAEAVKRYTELAAREFESLTYADSAEMAQLAQFLNVRMPLPVEREKAREAFELLNDAMDARLKEVPLEKKKAILDEAKVQLQEIMTQSRRP